MKKKHCYSIALNLYFSVAQDRHETTDPGMGQLSLVDNNVPQEELLMQVSRKFTVTANNKKSTFMVKKQVTVCRQQTETMSGRSSPKMDCEKDEVPSSSTCQTCALPTQLSPTAGEEDVIIILDDDDDEMPGSSQQAMSGIINHKRKATDVVEDNHGKKGPKRKRKNSSEILKMELRKSIPTVSGAKPILETHSLEITDDVSSSNRVGLTCVQALKSGTCNDNQGNTSSCTVRPDFGPQKAKILKPPNSPEIIIIDDDDDDTDISSGIHFAKTGKVHKCDNNGTMTPKKSFAESSSSPSGSGVSGSRAAASEWILHDGYSCLKRIFNAGVSAVSPTVLGGSKHDSGNGLRYVLSYWYVSSSFLSFRLTRSLHV